MAEDRVAELQARIRDAAQAQRPLRIRGGGSKEFYGRRVDGDVVDTRALRGIVDYAPTELVITARGGTPLAEVDAALADGEPDARVRAAALRGRHDARRRRSPPACRGRVDPYAGAVRDFVLGVRVVDGTGEALRFGGRVMKNVAGFDVARLMTGSLGTLGVLTEVSLKCLPRPAVEVDRRARVLGATSRSAWVNEWGGQPLPRVGDVLSRRAPVGAPVRCRSRRQPQRARRSAVRRSRRRRALLDRRARPHAPVLHHVARARRAAVATVGALDDAVHATWAASS